MKKAFTLVELLAVIIILSVILMIAVPQVLNVINNNKKSSFFVSAKAIARQVEYEDWASDTFTLDTLNNLDLSGTSTDNYDINNSYVYLDNGVFKINLIGLGKFAGLYACGVSKNSLDSSVVSTTPCNTPEIVEAPQLVQGMIPVYYDSNTMEWKKADRTNTSNSWYDYANQKWANAVTVSSTSRSGYQTSEVGKAISMTDINTMFVWIPRYSYEIPAGTGAREILIKFEAKDTPKATGNAVDAYHTHPAFTLDTAELSGIWVGKFETSGLQSSPTIKPDITSLRSLAVKAMYDTVTTYVQGSSTYGFSNTDNDTHMMKNTEWGAVAYLSGSKYGKYGNSNYTGLSKEIYLNNSSSKYAGRSMGTYGGAGITTTLYDGTNLYEYAPNGYYTYDGKCATINAAIPQCTAGTALITAVTDKTLSYGASTTGTIYGIYDMSGGTWDNVMAMYKPNPVGLGISDKSGYSTSQTDSQYDLLIINSKYYNPYPTTSPTTGYILGDATKETSAWYSDANNIGSTANPWIVNGGSYSNGSPSGIFCHSATSGIASYAFRIVIAPNS